MAETASDNESPADVQPVQAEDLLGLNPEVIRDVIVALEADDSAAIRDIVAPLHPAEVADLIEMLRGDMRVQLVEQLRIGFDPIVLSELDETVPRRLPRSILMTRSILFPRWRKRSSAACCTRSRRPCAPYWRKALRFRRTAPDASCSANSSRFPPSGPSAR